MLRNTNIEREVGIPVGVTVAQCGSVEGTIMVVNAHFPHTHTGQAGRVVCRAVHVPYPPLHKAHGHGGEDPGYGGHGETSQLAIGVIVSQVHGDHVPNGTGNKHRAS